MKVLSLFSGIGGFDLGFSRAGFEIAAMCEIDPQARAVLNARMPGIRVFEDVTKLEADHVGKIDVICAGFPCQDLSVAGRRAGLGGERSSLFFEVLRLARECKAPWVVLENVPGLLSSNGSRDMARLVWEFYRLGYLGAWRTLDAQYYSMAQRRRRVFFVFGARAECCAQALFEPESLQWDPDPREKARQADPFDVAGCLAGCSRGADDNKAQRGLLVAEEVAQTISASRKTDSAGKNGTGPINLIVANLAGTLTARKGRNGASNLDDVAAGHLIAYGPDGEDVAHALGARDFKGICNAGQGTMIASKDPQQVPAAKRGKKWAVRKLTARETERLQGFPDDWTLVDYRGKPMSDTARYRMTGNAVPVPVAQWIGAGILGER